MIKLNNGVATIASYKKVASEAFAFNDVVTRNSSGYLTKATATTPRGELLGLIQRDVLSTDSDYASNTPVPVQEFDEQSEFIADVDTGTALQAMVGKRFDLTDHNGINVNSTLQKSVQIKRVISTTKVIVGFVSGAGDTQRLQSYTQTVTRAQFTDGGSTAGTLDLSVSIPAGAVFARTAVTGITGFIGDTSAVLVVGDGTDADRYNTGTPSVFTTASQGVDVGAPSGTAFHTAAVTPKLTVTSAADFTNVSAGALTITLFWYAVE